MDPRKILFYTEQYEKANKKIKLCENFVALPINKPVSGKFYSKYEGLNSIPAPHEYIKLIERYKEMKPREIYPDGAPTINMAYGWFSEPLVARSTDRRIYFPLGECDVVKTEIRIRQADKNSPLKKFQGVPFKTN